jgi:XisH protein
VPAKDIYYDTVKIALQKNGWIVTHDPFPLQIGKKRLSADLGDLP